LAQLAQRSARARITLPSELDLAYGPDPCECLDFFPTTQKPAPLHVFVHGGHWQELGKVQSAFAAPAITAAGASFVALGYGLAPRYSVDRIVAQVRRGLRWIYDHADDLGSHPDIIYASGSSAGAHLVAMALCDAPGLADYERAQVAGACLMSGVYDLEPVRLSYINDVVQLNQRTAHASSPLYHLPCAAAEIIVARGARETNEYARQHDEFTGALRCSGHQVVDLVAADRDHFTLPADLGAPDTPLGQAVLAQMRLR
jgi:arylformamidase